MASPVAVDVFSNLLNLMKNMITASIVLFNTPENQLLRLLNCINLSGKIDRVYLIDNSPIEVDRACFRLPFVTYIKSDRNIGYGSGHNIALREILNVSEFHFIINPDIYFEPREIGALIDRIGRDASIGLLMPKIIYPDGSLQYLCKLIPSPSDLLLRRFFRGPFAKFVSKRNEDFELRFTGYKEEMDVPYLSGCFMLFRTSSLKAVGLFDERFFMYPEDIDITRRIHAKFRTVFYPHAEIVHDHARESYKNLKMLWIHVSNMIKYFNKWGWIFDAERARVNSKILESLKSKHR